MGDCAVTFKISVEDMDNINNVIEEVKKIRIGRVAKISTEDIGFGIRVVKATIIIPDKEGEMTKLEDAIKKIKGIQEADTVDINLIS